MPKFIAVYYETKRYERVIEANTLEKAHEIAEFSDIEDVVEDNEYYEWELMTIKELERS